MHNPTHNVDSRRLFSGANNVRRTRTSSLDKSKRNTEISCQIITQISSAQKSIPLYGSFLFYEIKWIIRRYVNTISWIYICIYKTVKIWIYSYFCNLKDLSYSGVTTHAEYLFDVPQKFLPALNAFLLIFFNDKSEVAIIFNVALECGY